MAIPMQLWSSLADSSSNRVIIEFNVINLLSVVDSRQVTSNEPYNVQGATLTTWSMGPTLTTTGGGTVFLWTSLHLRRSRNVSRPVTRAAAPLPPAPTSLGASGDPLLAIRCRSAWLYTKLRLARATWRTHTASGRVLSCSHVSLKASAEQARKLHGWQQRVRPNR